MEKKIFPEKENQPLSNNRFRLLYLHLWARYIYIYERRHPLLTPRLGTVDCGTQKGNGMTRNPKMEIVEPVRNRLLVGLLARAN